VAFMVMVNCPTTNEPVFTGLTVETVHSFASGTYDNLSFSNCTSCAGTHTWSKADAFLDS
jgi:hypothetical protein